MSAISPTAAGRLVAVTRPRGLLAREPWVFVLAGATAVLDAAASIIRQAHFGSGLDLGIFDQVIWHYSRFETPFSSIKGENLLGDHFHPLIAVLAPLYWIWSDVRMLLVAQAVLVAASIVPVFLFALPRLGRTAAYLVAGAYAVYWGVQVGVLYDFHEVAFAPLLIALAILLADRERWPWFWLVIVLLLGVKEDLSLFVAVFGIYLLTRREVRHGVALIVVGIAWYELATRVFIPHFSHGTNYVYWTYGELGKNPLSAIWALIKAPWRVFTIGFSPVAKVHTLLALFAPFLFLSLAAPRFMLLALPLLAERFLSTNSNFWFTHYDYSMSISPVLAAGAVAGLGNVSRLISEHRRRALIVAAAGAMLLTSIAVAKFGTADSAVSRLTSSGFYHAPAFAGPAARALAHVPAGASLGTQDALLSHVSHRRQITQIDPDSVGHNQYLIANVIAPSCCGVSGSGSYEVLGRVLATELPRMTPIYYDAGFLVLRRAPRGQPPGNGVLTPMSGPDARNVNQRALRWSAVLFAAFRRYFPCSRLWAVRAPRAPDCFAATNGALERDQRELSTAIRAALPSLTGGCEQLASAALAATHELTLDFTRFAPAAEDPDRLAFVAAFRTLTTDTAGLDLDGELNRLTILCSPRA